MSAVDLSASIYAQYKRARKRAEEAEKRGAAREAAAAYRHAAEFMRQYIMATQDPGNYVLKDDTDGEKRPPDYHIIPSDLVKAEARKTWAVLLDKAVAATTNDPDSLKRVQIQHKWYKYYLETTVPKLEKAK